MVSGCPIILEEWLTGGKLRDPLEGMEPSLDRGRVSCMELGAESVKNMPVKTDRQRLG